MAVEGDDRAEERTEEPTPRRLQRARRQGEVAFSRDLTAAAGLVGLLAVIASASPAAVARLVSYLTRTMATAAFPSDRTAALGLALRELVGLLGAPLLAVLAGGVLVGLVQTRGLLALEPLRVDPGRLLPSWRRLLGARALVEALKGLVKVAVVAALAWLTLRPLVRPLAALTGASAGAILRVLGHGARLLAVRLVAAAVVLGALDLLWQRRRHRRDLRMTRAEVRREHKESEGDPRHKAERQRLHRALAEQQILADVRKADFVVVNPDHLAVALRYDRAGDGAPVVVAKGERLLAEKIKEVAREAGVPIFRDVPLAHALAALDEGEPIPEALYQAVAEILRVVYGMERRAPDPRSGLEAGVTETDALVDVAVTLPLLETFTYRDPRGVRPPLGAQVVVPFGARMVTGFVVAHREHATGSVRDIEEVVGEGPAVDEEILELCRFAAGYYVAPLGEVLRAALPQSERAEAARRMRLTEAGARLVALEASGGFPFESLSLDDGDRALLQRLARARSLSARGRGRTDPRAAARVARLVAAGLVEIGDEVRGQRTARKKKEGTAPPAVAPELPVLNAHQAKALEALIAALPSGFATFVLQGITGSGKTEVYLRLIAEARRAGKGALVMVPEIALTPQLAARFRARFGDDVAVLHSGLPPGQRRAAWRRLRAGEVGIALGARSAVFAPVRDLAVVVVDEEHDGSFKQEEGVRYHGRDLAVVRAQKAGALAVLGSATPSLETARNVVTGRFKRLLLPVRANPAAASRPLPPVQILDLRKHPPGPDGLLSPPLTEAISATLAAGDQVILFLNRRGFATLMLCRACGHVVRCPHCAVSMTYHRGRERLICHYCARTQAVPQACPECRKPALEALGVGTEQVENVVRERFPTARVARLDRDTAGERGGRAVEDLLQQVHDRQLDILVGTQMVTKGHDFAGVTLVGVLAPDQGMHLPDFRATERTFSLLEQVSGRAGRGEQPGRVIVQTYSPDHPAIESLRTHDYEGFVKGELARREEAHYPPFSRMIAIRVDGPDESQVRAVAADAAARARATAAPSLRVLGPAEAPIARLRGRCRWQVWLAAPDRATVGHAARAAAEASLPRDVRLAIDVDPQSVL